MPARWILTIGLGALAAAGALNLSLADRLRQAPYDVSHVPDGEVARIASLGHRGLVSDLYWLSTVQYIGESRSDERGWDKLLPLVDLVTDLDPRHGYAYQTAGVVLSSVRRLEESNRILRKGIEEGPNWWSYPYYIAFNHWFYLGDYVEGARWAEIAARTPGASANVSHLALSLKSKSGTPEDAIEMLGELRASARDEVTIGRLEEQMKLAVLERDAQRLERAVEAFRERHGRDPFGLDELVVGGLVDRIPPDPFGGQYQWSREDGRVRSSANPFRFSQRAPPAPPPAPAAPTDGEVPR
jgi:hypothetical protein